MLIDGDIGQTRAARLGRRGHKLQIVSVLPRGYKDLKKVYRVDLWCILD